MRPTAEKRTVKGDKFAGKSFVFTGTLANRSREEAGELVKQHGAKISGSVSKKTDYVVVGSDPGSKIRQSQGTRRHHPRPKRIRKTDRVALAYFGLSGNVRS